MYYKKFISNYDYNVYKYIKLNIEIIIVIVYITCNKKKSTYEITKYIIFQLNNYIDYIANFYYKQTCVLETYIFWKFCCFPFLSTSPLNKLFSLLKNVNALYPSTIPSLHAFHMYVRTSFICKNVFKGPDNINSFLIRRLSNLRVSK